MAGISVGRCFHVGCVGDGMIRDLEKALARELADHGVTEYEIVDGGKHWKLKYLWQGAERLLAVPRSPYGQRFIENSKTQLRRQMGVRRITNKTPANRKRKRKTKCPACSNVSNGQNTTCKTVLVHADMQQNPWETIPG